MKKYYKNGHVFLMCSLSESISVSKGLDILGIQYWGFEMLPHPGCEETTEKEFWEAYHQTNDLIKSKIEKIPHPVKDVA